MPRSRKQSQRARTASPEKNITDVKADAGLEMDKSYDDILTYVQEMFAGQVDPDVVHMILSESEWRVEEAVDTLFRFVGNDKRQAGRPSNKLFELASTVLANKENMQTNSDSAKGDICLITSMDSLDPIVIPSRKGRKAEEKFEAFVAGENTVSQQSNNDAFGKYGLCTFDVPASESGSAVTTQFNPYTHSQVITSDFEASCTNISDKAKTAPDVSMNPSDRLVSVGLYPLSSGTDLPNSVGAQSLDKHVAVASTPNLSVNLSKTLSPDLISNTERIFLPHGADAISLSSRGSVGIKSDFVKSSDFATIDSCDTNSRISSDISANCLLKDPNSATRTANLSCQQTRVPSCSVEGNSGMKVAELLTPVETQKNEILKSANSQNLQYEKMYFPAPSPVTCGTLSDMSVEENRGSISASVLSADAPEFVPSWASPRPDQHANKGGLINPWEMSVPGMSTSKLTYVNKAWPRPTEKFSLSDAMKHTSKNRTLGSKQLHGVPQKSNVWHVQREIIENYMKSGEKVLVLLRGCPGSGKSTLARQIKFDGTILTTDDYFMRGNFYEYDQGLLGDAHLWNQQRSEEAMKAGISPVIIDNTNSQRWEMKPYVAQALKYGYNIELMEPQTKWKYKARELCKRNGHNVGLESIQRMLQRFEYHVTVDDIMNSTQTGKQNRSQVKEGKENKKLSGEVAKANTETLLQENAVTGSHQFATAATPPGGEIYTSVTVSQGRAPSSNADVIMESEEEIDISDDESNSATSSRETSSVNRSSSKECLESDSGVSDEVVMTPGTYVQNTEGTKAQRSSGLRDVNKLCNFTADVDRSFHLGMLPDKPPLIPMPEGYKTVIDSKPPIISKPQEHSSVKETHDKSSSDLTTSIIPGHDICDHGTKVSSEVSSSIDSLGQVGMDILADVASELAMITSPSEIDVIENEFKALIYCAPLPESEKGEVERRLAETIKLRKLQYQGSTEVDQSDSKNGHCKAKSSRSRNASQHEQGETPKEREGIVEKDSKGGSFWDAPAPKPQRRPRVHSSSEDRMFQADEEVPQVGADSGVAVVSDTVDTSQLSTSEDQLLTPQAGKNATKTQRKSRRKQVRRPPSPLFDTAVKERFLSNPWAFPDACASDSSEDCGAATGTRVQPSINVKTGTPVKVERASNTCPRDFNILHCVNQGYKASAIEEEFKLLPIQQREINTDHADNEKSEERVLGGSGMLDRGTSTDDLQEQMNEKFGLEFLQSCFKDVPLDDLMDILASCGNDVGDAVNILLEWGYDYIASPEQRKKIALNRLKSPDEVPMSMHSLWPVESADDKMTPVSLTDLCSQVAKVSLSVSDSYIEELLISGSQKRLAVVEKVTMRCERLLSCEGGADSKDDVWVREGAVLCLYSDSEDSDMAYSSDNEESATTEQESEGPVKGVRNSLFFIPAQQTQRSGVKGGEKLVRNVVSDALGLDEKEGNSEISELDSEVSDREMPNTFAPRMSTRTTQSDKTGCLDPSVPELSHGSTAALAPELSGNADIDRSSTSSVSDIGSISLNLPRQVIETLEAIFGPVTSGPDAGARNSQVIDVDYTVARELHKSLKTAFSKKENIGPAKNLPAVRRRKTALNLPSLRTSQRRVRTPLKRPVAPLNPPPWYSKDPVNFREILDEETAIQLSKEEHLKLLESSGDAVALSTRLKRQKLQDMFPGVNGAMIDEFFEANGFSLEESRLALQSLLGTGSPPQTILSAELADGRENQLINMAMQNSLMDLQPRKSLPLIVTSEPSTAEEYGLEYQDFRAEAFTHHKLRQECFQKAQDAYRRGMKDVASFYSQQGHLHSEKLREANRRASQRILCYRNADLNKTTTIDLHGLHPVEAVRYLSQILKERHQDLRQTSGRQRCHLTVIMGRGTHSRGGRAKVYPAVVDFLTKSNYSWSHQASGVVQVVLRG